MMRVDRWRALWLLLVFALVPGAQAADLPETIERVTPSIVVIGTVAPLRQPKAEFRGTGFVIGDGRHVLTNAHVLPNPVEMKDKERLAVFSGAGREVQARGAEIVARDRRHDLAVLRFEGERLPALKLAQGDGVRAGERYAFTGFPIGMVLGMHPVTHEALISSITPIAIPQGRARELDPAIIRQLDEPWDVFQLDGTAYPGNSGSPLYHPATAEVVGVLNMVFVKGTKENVLKEPSGIAYAIPIRHARPLVDEALSR
ncbi:MAG: serine protease [Halofilum sp. (in: g-proteobacteria)]|nr:serine protease [Halofilum sp. (in: g-proteobacteria)]